MLVAAAQLIAERGFSETRIADVAERVGASPALVIYYFGTKDSLLTEALRWSERSFYAAVEEMLQETPSLRARIENLVEACLPESEDVPDDWGLWFDLWAQAFRHPEVKKDRAQLDQQWRDLIARVVEAGVDAGEIERGRRRGLHGHVGRPARRAGRPGRARGPGRGRGPGEADRARCRGQGARAVLTTRGSLRTPAPAARDGDMRDLHDGAGGQPLRRLAAVVGDLGLDPEPVAVEDHAGVGAAEDQRLHPCRTGGWPPSSAGSGGPVAHGGDLDPLGPHHHVHVVADRRGVLGTSRRRGRAGPTRQTSPSARTSVTVAGNRFVEPRKLATYELAGCE